MSHFRRPRPKRSLISRLALPLAVAGLACGAFALLTSPDQLSNSNGRVFEVGVTITLDRASPAFAAMEDSLLGTRLVESESLATAQPTLVQFLSAGTESVEWLAEKISRDNRREEALLTQARLAREAQSQALAQAAVEALQRMAASLSAPPPEPVKVVQAEASKNPRKVINHPTRTISLTDLRMSREELVSGLLMPLATATAGEPQPQATVVATRGAPPVYRRYRPDGNGPPLLGGVSPRGGGRVDTSARVNPPARETVSARAVGLQPEEEAAEAATVTQLVIAGPIEFAGGLAVTSSNDRVVVYRDVEGETIEAGAVWLREGRYEIFVNETSGTLIGELKTPQGFVMGRGAFDLADLPAIGGSQHRVDSVALKITPVPQGISGRVLSAYSHEGKSFPIAGARVASRDLPIDALAQKDGSFQENSLAEGSSIMVRASRPGHWGSLAFASVGKPIDIPLYPDKMLTAFLSLTKSTSANDNAAIIWGRVTQGGQPVAGAKVELMTSPEEIAPVYFNSMMLPDTSLTTTSANGIYAFFPVKAGSHAAQAEIQNQTTEPVIFATEEKTVSSVDLEVSSDRRARVRVFDAFRTDWPLAAELTDPSGTKTITIERGEGLIRFPSGKTSLILDADAGRGYERVRLTIDRDKRSVFVPMLQTKWIEEIRESLRSSIEPETGSIVGFIQGSSAYRVTLEERNVLNTSKLVYFDSRGVPTGKAYGDPGGGFMILNVPEGFRTVAVQVSGASSTFATTVMVERRVINVVSQYMK